MTSFELICIRTALVAGRLGLALDQEVREVLGGPGSPGALPAQWEAGFSAGRGQADVRLEELSPHLVLSSGAGREVPGQPWNARSAEEDLLHEGPWASGTTYQA